MYKSKNMIDTTQQNICLVNQTQTNSKSSKDYFEIENPNRQGRLSSSRSLKQRKPLNTQAQNSRKTLPKLNSIVVEN